jgi:hypothetical protein
LVRLVVLVPVGGSRIWELAGRWLGSGFAIYNVAGCWWPKVLPVYPCEW